MVLPNKFKKPKNWKIGRFLSARKNVRTAGDELILILTLALGLCADYHL